MLRHCPASQGSSTLSSRAGAAGNSFWPRGSCGDVLGTAVRFQLPRPVRQRVLPWEGSPHIELLCFALLCSPSLSHKLASSRNLLSGSSLISGSWIHALEVGKKCVCSCVQNLGEFFWRQVLILLRQGFFRYMPSQCFVLFFFLTSECLQSPCLLVAPSVYVLFLQ